MRSGISSERVVGLFGPSGAGKTTLARLLAERWPERYRTIRTLTTRTERADDEGSYAYVSEGAFARLEAEGAFLATTEIPSASEVRRYGYLWDDLRKAGCEGRIVLVPVERALAAQLRERLAPETLFIVGLRPPGKTPAEQTASLRQRLEGRYAGRPELLAERLANAEREDLPLMEAMAAPGLAGPAGPRGLLDAVVETAGSPEEAAAAIHQLVSARWRLPR